jgi:[ribosomal protein S18]-alanine N-acetyltransferase
MRFFRATPRVLPAEPTEAAVLADLYRLAWAGCERLLDERLLSDQVPTPADVQAWLQGGFEVFRVRHEGQVIGAVRCCFPTSACQVDRLAVDPDARGRGVGRLLLDHAVGRARRAGVTRVWVQVSPKLDAAQGLFRTFGFRESGRLRTRYWNEDLVLLELPV